MIGPSIAFGLNEFGPVVTTGLLNPWRLPQGTPRVVLVDVASVARSSFSGTLIARIALDVSGVKPADIDVALVAREVMSGGGVVLSTRSGVEVAIVDAANAGVSGSDFGEAKVLRVTAAEGGVQILDVTASPLGAVFFDVVGAKKA